MRRALTLDARLDGGRLHGGYSYCSGDQRYLRGTPSVRAS
jgi:hypothetical protein